MSSGRLLTVVAIVAGATVASASRSYAQAAGVQGSRPPAQPPHRAPQPPRPPGEQSSRNMTVLSHLPMGGFLRLSDIELEQELSRPYVYICKRFVPTGLDIVSIKDPTQPKVIWSWVIENAELHEGSGALDNKYVKRAGRYYDVQSFQFSPGGPDADLGAIIWDVTGLPDTSTIREVMRIRVPEAPGGFHNIFAYQHSNGQALLFATTQSEHAYVYDIDRAVSGDPEQGLVAKIPAPQQPTNNLRGWHDFYAGYDPVTSRDRLFGAAHGGYYVMDISNLGAPQLLASVTGVAGVNRGHTFTPTPDGRFAFGMTEPHYQYSVVRFFDLKPALDGDVKNISRPISAWTANWRNVSHNHEVRWPYAFIAAFEDGLQVINIMDPANPYTVAYHDTWDGPHEARAQGNPSMGPWGVDVRNADGLIVVSDIGTGLWTFRMNGFDGWNGNEWGMPNQSSVQDWDNGPDGAPTSARVSAR